MYNLYLKEILIDHSNISKAKKILWFPITSGIKEDYCTVLENRLNAYYEMLDKYKDEIFEKIKPQESISLEENNAIVAKIDSQKMTLYAKTLIDGIIECHKKYRSGRQTEAYQVLFKAFDDINLKLLLENSAFIQGLDNGHSYFRIRKGKKTNEKKDFYHISFRELYLCKEDRFNIKGYPCLYLSYSEDCCKHEVDNYSKEDDSIATFTFKGNTSDNDMKLLDLTWNDKYDNEDGYETIKNEKENIIIHILWPLIAACKGISRFCKDTDKECLVNKNFKIEYVIPQMLAEYVHYHLGLKGIIYFTVRNEDLDPTKSEMKNFILFTEQKGDSEYDMDLLNEFDIRPINEKTSIF